MQTALQVFSRCEGLAVENVSADSVVRLAIISHCCLEGDYCHSNPTGCHYKASSCGYLFLSCVTAVSQLCVCMYEHEKQCIHACGYVRVCVYHACVCGCVCNLQCSFPPRVHNLPLLYDECVVPWCMCGLGMKWSAGPCGSSAHCVQTHHYWNGSIDCLLVFLFFFL